MAEIEKLLETHMKYIGDELKQINDHLHRINSRCVKHEERLGDCEKDTGILKDARSKGIITTVLASIGAFLAAVATIILKDKF